MKQLKCEMCGSSDLIKQDGVFVCQSCGCKYSVEEARKLMIEGTVDVSGSTVKIDDSAAIKEQISNWKKIADDAYNNKNFPEAYNYYCKVLEKDTEDWVATFRKGMSIAWQGNLNNLHINEMVGGYGDALRLLWNDKTQNNTLKADGKVMMGGELFDISIAIAEMTAKNCAEYGNKTINGAENFFERECRLAELLILEMNNIDEYVYQNCSNKNGIVNLKDAICGLSNIVVENMRTHFKIKTGRKYNSFLRIYQDVYQNVDPGPGTVTSRNNLITAVNTFERSFNTWIQNYNQKIKEEQIKKFWEENPSIYSEYKEKSEQLEQAKKEREEASNQLNEARKKLRPITNSYNSLEETIRLRETEIDQLSKKIFGKKKAEEDIEYKQKELSECKQKLAELEPSKTEGKNLVNTCTENLELKCSMVDNIQREIKQILKDNQLE